MPTKGLVWLAERGAEVKRKSGELHLNLSIHISAHTSVLSVEAKRSCSAHQEYEADDVSVTP